MNNFVFYNPTRLIFGKNTIPRIGEEIKKTGLKKVLFIAGGGSIRKNGVYEQTADSLRKAGIEWVETWGVQPNPVLSKVREMTDLAKKEKVEAVLAVGGGSVIDSGKSVAAGMFLDDPWQAYQSKQEVSEALPLFAVLTISATGTEMDPFAVLTNEKDKKKWNISGPALYPRVSIVDPSVQATLPWCQTANGAIDALSHIMEFYFMGGSAETVLSLDEALFRSIVSMTDKLKADPSDYEARANLAWAATMALNGTSGAGQSGGDWASHGIEHAVSALNPDVAHGAGLGVIFPAWISYCRDTDPELFRRWALNIWGADSVEAGVRAYKQKISDWGNPVRLSSLGVDEYQFQAIADHVLKHGMTGSKKVLSRGDLINILKLSL